MTYFYELKRSEEINLINVSIDTHVSLPKISPSWYGSIIDKYIQPSNFFDSTDEFRSIFCRCYVKWYHFIVFMSLSLRSFLISYTRYYIVSFLKKIFCESTTQSSWRSCYNNYFFIHDLFGYRFDSSRESQIYLSLLRSLLVWSEHFQDLPWWVYTSL